MERKFISHCTELKGSHYAIGYQLGLLVHSLPPPKRAASLREQADQREEAEAPEGYLPLVLPGAE